MYGLTFRGLAASAADLQAAHRESWEGQNMSKYRSKNGHLGLWRAAPASTPGVGDLMVESGFVPLSIGFAQGPSSPLKTLFSSTCRSRFEDFGWISACRSEIHPWWALGSSIRLSVALCEAR